MQFICLYFPAIISLIILNNQNKKKPDLVNNIYNYISFNLSINFTILLIAKIIFKLESYLFNITFSLKYLTLASILAFVYAYLYLHLKKHLSKEKLVSFFKKIIIGIPHIYKKVVICIKNVINAIVKFFKRHSIIINKILLFILILLLMFLFDFPLRSVSYSINNFYPVLSVCPILFDLAYVFLIYAIILLLNKKLSLIFTSLFYIVSLLFFITDYMMLRIKEEAFTFYDFNNASEGFEYLNFVIKEISFKFVMIVILSMLLFILLFILIRKIANTKMKTRIIILVASIILFILLRIIALSTLEDYEDSKWDRVLCPKYYYNNYISPKRSISVAGFYEYTIRDAYLKFKSRNEKIGSIEEIDEIINSSSKKYEPNKYSGIFKDKNLIMIMLESVDHIMFTKENMPTLTYMYNNGLTFSKRYNQSVGAGATIATELTSLTGLFYVGKYYNLNNNNYLESLPNVFNNIGYQTNSIHENKGIYYNRVGLHKQIGFQNSYFVLDHKPDIKRYHDELLVEDEDIYNQIINKGDNDHFMSFIVTISSHGPYANNYACSADTAAMESEKNCASYLAKRTDLFLELLLKKLKEDNLLDDTVIVLYADHYAYSYNYSDEEKNLYEKVDDNQSIQNLPLIIYSSTTKGKIFNDNIVDDIDIVPTLFNLFGVTYDPKYYIGTDVFSKDHENVAVFVDNSWYDGNIYSFNKDVDKNSDYYIQTTKYATDLIDLNTMIISNDYYNKTN